MAAEVFEVQLVSPEQILFEGSAEMVVCRALDGDIAFLKDHVPYLGVLDDDAVRIIQPEDTETAAAVHGGFVQMNGEKLVVLSDLAELKDDIDVPRAERAKQNAEAALAADPDDTEAQAALARAETRLKVAGVTS
jgi:F-type H+-transporting ATPase subunit epsilon